MDISETQCVLYCKFETAIDLARVDVSADSLSHLSNWIARLSVLWILLNVYFFSGVNVDVNC